jgi:hypothetical protein
MQKKHVEIFAIMKFYVHPDQLICEITTGLRTLYTNV